MPKILTVSDLHFDHRLVEKIKNGEQVDRFNLLVKHYSALTAIQDTYDYVVIAGDTADSIEDELEIYKALARSRCFGEKKVFVTLGNHSVQQWQSLSVENIKIVLGEQSYEEPERNTKTDHRYPGRFFIDPSKQREFCKRKYDYDDDVLRMEFRDVPNSVGSQFRHGLKTFGEQMEQMKTGLAGTNFQLLERECVDIGDDIMIFGGIKYTDLSKNRMTEENTDALTVMTSVVDFINGNVNLSPPEMTNIYRDTMDKLNECFRNHPGKK
jgi:hypothetical protein